MTNNKWYASWLSPLVQMFYGIVMKYSPIVFVAKVVFLDSHASLWCKSLQFVVAH